jgi:hypothetical protein
MLMPSPMRSLSLSSTISPRWMSIRNFTNRRTLLCEQAFGESLDPDKLERLVRYEVHLDRKLERMLATLPQLKDLRQGATAG